MFKWLFRQPTVIDTASQVGFVSLYDQALAARLKSEALAVLPKQLASALPAMKQWVDTLVASSAQAGVGLTSEQRQSLLPYYPVGLLDKIRVVVTPQCPSLPLKELGIGGINMPDGSKAAGITFLDTYFVQTGEAKRMSLHFHEAVHVVQWNILGAEAFIATYAAGLLRHGYRDSPLEVMAFDSQDRFEAKEVFSVISVVRDALNKLRVA